MTMGAVQFALLYTAIKLGMPAGLSSVVLQMQVFFTAVLAYVYFGEKPLPLEIAGGLVALVGVVLIGVLEHGAVELVPFALVSASALAWASGSIISKAARPRGTRRRTIHATPGCRMYARMAPSRNGVRTGLRSQSRMPTTSAIASQIKARRCTGVRIEEFCCKVISLVSS